MGIPAGGDWPAITSLVGELVGVAAVEFAEVTALVDVGGGV